MTAVLTMFNYLGKQQDILLKGNPSQVMRASVWTWRVERGIPLEGSDFTEGVLAANFAFVILCRLRIIQMFLQNHKIPNYL